MDFSPIQENAAFKEFFSEGSFREKANSYLFCFINPFAKADGNPERLIIKLPSDLSDGLERIQKLFGL